MEVRVYVWCLYLCASPHIPYLGGRCAGSSERCARPIRREVNVDSPVCERGIPCPERALSVGCVCACVHIPCPGVSVGCVCTCMCRSVCLCACEGVSASECAHPARGTGAVSVRG